MGESYNFQCQNDGSKPQAIVSVWISEKVLMSRIWLWLAIFYLELWKIVILNLRWFSLMFWRCDRTYICEKVANYSKCPQTSPYGWFAKNEHQLCWLITTWQRGSLCFAIFCNFLVPIPLHVSPSCSYTRLVSAYIVALFQCFRMVPVSCSSGGQTKTCPQKLHPSWTRFNWTIRKQRLPYMKQ